jgi:hypothetical protein
MGRTWRDDAAKPVAEAIRVGESLGLKGKELVRHCNRQFPWGQRRYHPYEIWKSEVKRQLGLVKVRFGEPSRPADIPGQGLMF